MNNMKFRSRLLPAMMAVCIAALPMRTGAEDIDIFVGNAGNLGTQGVPNVLIIIDNSSNFSANNQGWTVPNKSTKYTQGQAEVRSIKQALTNVTGVNVGLMLMVDNGSGGGSSGSKGGGWINFALKYMEPTRTAGNNKDGLFSRL